MKKVILGLACAATLMFAGSAFAAEDPAVTAFKASINEQIGALTEIAAESPSLHTRLNIKWTIMNLKDLLASL